MFKFLSFVLVACLSLAACQRPGPAPVDKDAAKKAVADLFDSYGKALKAKDVNGITATLADDILFICTDPNEFWNREQLVTQLNSIAKDSTFSWEFTVNKREIRLSPDGMMAIVAEQEMIPMISGKISVRSVGHARMIDGQWKIDFYSFAITPRNEDMAKLNKAME